MDDKKINKDISNNNMSDDDDDDDNTDNNDNDTNDDIIYLCVHVSPQTFVLVNCHHNDITGAVKSTQSVQRNTAYPTDIIKEIDS